MTARPTLTFGDDQSPAADIGWLWINNHPWSGWRLETITAHLPTLSPPPPPEETRLHAWEPPHPRQLFAEAGFAEVEHLTAQLDPRLALNRPADLLVIGARGHGMLKALHVGSTAEWLLQHPPAPLAIIHAGHTVRSIIACHDGSSHAQRALDALTRLPLSRDAHLTILIVDDGRADIASTNDLTSQVTDGLDTETVVIANAKPTPAILEQITQRQPDLVALGTRGHTGLQRLRLGSTAGAVTRAATCSILLACVDDLTASAQ